MLNRLIGIPVEGCLEGVEAVVDPVMLVLLTVGGQVVARIVTVWGEVMVLRARAAFVRASGRVAAGVEVSGRDRFGGQWVVRRATQKGNSHAVE